MRGIINPIIATYTTVWTVAKAGRARNMYRYNSPKKTHPHIRVNDMSLLSRFLIFSEESAPKIIPTIKRVTSTNNPSRSVVRTERSLMGNLWNISGSVV
jgi:hypothetical protein